MVYSQVNWQQILAVLGMLIGGGILLTSLAAVWVFWRVRHVTLPAGADFFEALRATPLSVVILLDLLDFTFDIFSAPVSWFILGRLGLKPLRFVTAIEALIPGTEILPTMTIAWFISRYKKNIRLPDYIASRGSSPRLG
jgi:hypothetical protein